MYLITVLKTWSKNVQNSKGKIDKAIKIDKSVEIVIPWVTDRTVGPYIIDRAISQILTKNIENLNNPIKQLDLIDVYRSLQSKKAEHTFFSGPHKNFTKIIHVKDHKISFKTCKILRAYRIYYQNTKELS